MNRSDLINQIAKDAGISKVAASKALDSIINNITTELKKPNGRITLIGFGTFSKGLRKARLGRNPQTGAVIKIRASKVIKFKSSKILYGGPGPGH